MKRFLYIFSLITILFIACDNGEEEVNLSTETRVNTFTFYEDTLNPGLTEAVFKIEHKSWPDTGLIYCVDSLRYGTCLDSVVPYVTYVTTPSTAVFVTPDTTLVSTGADTLNMNQKPIYLYVQAADTAYKRCYRIEVNVHQADPELYVWKKLSDGIFAPQNCDMKAFFSNDLISLYVNNGFSTTIYQSSNGSLWKTTDAPTGLPTPCHVRDILQHGDTLYYIANDKLYTSTNLLQWSEINFADRDFAPVNMLVTFDGKAWCVVQDHATQELMLASIKGTDIQVETICGLADNKLPKNFPVSDFAA